MKPTPGPKMTESEKNEIYLLHVPHKNIMLSYIYEDIMPVYITHLSQVNLSVLALLSFCSPR